MRDPNRIDRICGQLAEIWKRESDWRLSQLLSNFQRYMGYDLFYMEDENFIENLDNYLNIVEGNHIDKPLD